MYLIFSFLRFAVTYQRWKCICFSIFRGLQSLPGAEFVSAFLLFPICSHFGNPGVYLFFSFWRFAVTLGFMSVSAFSLFLQSAVTFGTWDCILFSPFSNLQSHFNPGNVSAFLLFAICGHLPAPESDVQSLVSNKKTQQKTIFSPDAAGFFRQ